MALTSELPILSRKLVEDKGFRESHKFIVLPKEDAFDLPVKYLQIGIGAYIRGHADYFIDLVGEGRAVAIQPNTVEVPHLLSSQHGLYTLVSMSGDAEKSQYEYRVISCIARALPASTEWEKTLQLVSSTPLELVLMVVTEQGVKVDESDTGFNGLPCSAIGKLTKLLYTQWLHFPRGKLTVLDTDNVSENGRVVRNSVLRMVDDVWKGKLDERFKDWLRENVAFPISLCDRMVPGGRGRISQEKLEGFWRELGYRDECLITAEPFRMWVIEDWFAGARPDFERVGVRVVPRAIVKAYEDMKLQVLNGAHTSIVHAGCLLRIEYIKDTIRHPLIRAYVESLIFDEVGKFLEVPDANPVQFGREVIKRFENRELEHTNYQVAMYGTEKVRDRLMPPLFRYIERTGELPKMLPFAIALLLRYITGYEWGRGVDTKGRTVEGMLGVDEKGQTYYIDDPRAESISRRLTMNLPRSEAERVLDEVLADTEIFRRNLLEIPPLAKKIKENYHLIRERGVEEALRLLLEHPPAVK